MLEWLMKRRIEAFENRWGYDMGYAKEILAADPRALLALARVGGLAAYRRGVPKAAYWAAKAVATLHEDCGPCTQLVVAQALDDGVSPATLDALLRDAPDALGDEVLTAVRFARATLAHAAEADALRDAVIERWGARGLVSLAFAITAGRVFPTLKYALGHGRACQRITVIDRATNLEVDAA